MTRGLIAVFLTCLLLSTIPLFGQRAYLKDHKVSYELPPIHTLPASWAYYDLTISSQDSSAALFFDSNNRELKIASKSRAENLANFYVVLETGQFRILNQKVRKNEYNSTYHIEIEIEFPAQIRIADKDDSTIYDQQLFHRNTIVSEKEESFRSLTANYYEWVEEVKQSTFRSVMDSAALFLSRFSPGNERLTISLGTVASKKQDYSRFDEVLVDAVEALSLLAKSGDKEQAMKLLNNPLLFWKGELEKLQWQEKNQRGAIVVCLYNLAVSYYYLSDLTSSLEYLNMIQPSSGNGAAYFSGIYKGLLKKRIYAGDSSLQNEDSNILLQFQEANPRGLLGKLAKIAERSLPEKSLISQNDPVQPDDRPYIFIPEQWSSLYSNLYWIKPEISIPEDYPSLQRVAEEANLFKNWRDTPGIKQYVLKAELNLVAGNYRDALKNYTKTIELWDGKSNATFLSRAELFFRVARTHMLIADYDNGLQNLGHSLKLLTPDEEVLRSMVLDEYGKYYISTGSFNEGLDYFNRSKNILENTSDENLEILMVNSLVHIAETRYKMGEFSEALGMFKNVLKASRKLLPDRDGRIADVYAHLANTFSQLSLKNPDDKSLQKASFMYADSALNMRAKTIAESHPSLVASNYTNLDFNPTSFTRKDLKLESFNFFEHRQYRDDPNLQSRIVAYDSLIALTQLRISPLHSSIADYKKLIMQANKQFYVATKEKWTKATRGADGVIVGLVNQFRDVGESKDMMETRIENFKFSEAYAEKIISDFKQSIDHLTNNLGERHPDVSDQHLELMLLYQEIISNYHEFLVFFNERLKSMESTRKDLAAKLGTESENYQAYVDKYDKLESQFYDHIIKTIDLEKNWFHTYKEAVSSCLHHSIPGNENIRDILNRIESQDINSVLLSTDVFRKILATKVAYHFPQTKSLQPPIPGFAPLKNMARWDWNEDDISQYGAERFDDLTLYHFELRKLYTTVEDFGTIQDYDQYIDHMILSLIHEEDRFLLTGKTRSDRVAIIEKLISQLLIDNSASSTPKIGGAEYINDIFGLTQKSKALTLLHSMNKVSAGRNSQISPQLAAKKKNLETKIRLAKRKVAEKNSEYLDSLSHYKEGLTLLERDLKIKFPKYAATSTSFEPFTIEKVASTLDSKSALISYTYTNNNLFRITITRDQPPEYRVISSKGSLSKKIKGFRNSILYFQEDTYEELGRELAHTLLPKMNKEIDQLIIIPDGDLYTIPFEALLTGKVKSDEDYSAYPYLIKEYQVSYELSISLFMKKASDRQVINKGSFLGIAPVFDGVSSQQLDNNNINTITKYDALDSAKTRGLLMGNGNIQSLPGTSSEVSSIAELLSSSGHKTDVYMREEAGESKLKTNDLIDYKFLHLATHGFVNTQYPELSGLMFAQNEQSEDGILYSGEIYDLNLNAELIALSACETGLGRLITGEGVIGLTRAFLYAGAKNLLISYWKVSDRSTSDLMINFYKELWSKEQSEFSYSLTQAKKSLIDSGEFSHPYYWSSFVLVGY